MGLHNAFMHFSVFDMIAPEPSTNAHALLIVFFICVFICVLFVSYFPLFHFYFFVFLLGSFWKSPSPG